MLRRTHPAKTSRAVALAATVGLAALSGGCVAEVPPHDEFGEPTAEAALPIAGGYDDDDDKAVVGLIVRDHANNLAKTCSGTLLAPNLVLTAQHCIADTASFVDCTSSAFGAGVEAYRVAITTHPSMWSSAALWRTAREIVVPPGEPTVCGRDVALLILEEPVPEDEATPMRPRLSRLVDESEAYSAIGYGNSDHASGDAGLRRRRDGLFVQCVGQGCGSAGHVDGREWRGDQGICNGDSGGPAIDMQRRVIGVTSRGPIGCNDPIYGGLTAWKDWIRETALRAAEMGDYRPPAWIDPRSSDDASEDSLVVGGWTSCTAARHTRASDAAPLALLFALGMVVVGRRRVR